MTWAQVIIALVVGVTGIGFAQVLKAFFGRRLLGARADQLVVKNAQVIIDELKERQTELTQQYREEIEDLRVEVRSLRNELAKERQLARIEIARLESQIALKDRELLRLRGRDETL